METSTNGTNSVDSTKKTQAPRGTKVLGIKVAPLNTPWQNRMQTLAVASWIYTFFSAPAGIFVVLYVFLYTSYWYLAIAYMIFFYYDRNVCNEGGRRLNWFRNLKWWKNYCDYYPIQLIKTVDLDPSKNYLFGSHPHGVLCSGAFGCFATEGRDFSKKFPGITPHLLTLEGHYSFPLYRDYAMAFGGCSASRESITYLLTRPGGGHAAILVPGGAPESLDCHPGAVTRIQLGKRKGFIKMAIRIGAPLVPVYSFGETDIFEQVPNPPGSKLRRFQDWLQAKMGVAPAIIMGRGIFQYSFGVVPKRHPIHVVVGAPIEVEKMDNPTQEAIDSTHKRYCDAVMDLFNKYKELYADKDDVLKIEY